MKAIILEDEILVARDLQKLIHDTDPGLEVIAVLHSLEEARLYFAANAEPDLLFMDIQLSDGVSFDLFDQVKLECPVIFTTAYNEYAIRAFQVNSVDYLLKPIDRADLERALEKFHRWGVLHPADFQDRLSHLLRDMRPAGHENKRYKERFMVHHGKSLVPVIKDQVACFVKDELIFLITLDGEKHLTDFETLDGLEDLLDPGEFFRANRQYIIRAGAVAQVKPHFTGKLIVSLIPHALPEIDISREKASSFKSWLA